jgi:hypothetical protein
MHPFSLAVFGQFPIYCIRVCCGWFVMVLSLSLSLPVSDAFIPFMNTFFVWFDRQKSGRNVALPMDNFYAHQAAVTEIQPNGYPLQNTLTILHPADSKSVINLLIKGISSVGSHTRNNARSLYPSRVCD